jgi:hypothetical protein
MHMRGTRSDFLYSRRAVMRALGAAAIAGLPGCGGSSPGQPPSGSPPRTSDGYTDQQSYRPGDRVTLFLSTNFPQSTTLFLEDYAGRVNPTVRIPVDLVTQPVTGETPWETGFGFQATTSFKLPDDLRSGVYLVDRYIPVIVKTAPAAPADVVILYPTNTVAAYNTAGGRSMYSEPHPAPIVSFLRAVGITNQSAYHESFLRWFAGLDLPYSFRYLADIDLEDYSELSGSKLLVAIGHSEYWTRRARENFDEFVRGGGNALMLSGNNMWWQVRYSDDRSQMICYKLVHDPVLDPMLRTINWTNSFLEYPVLRSIGGDFLHGGFGGPGFRVLLPNSPVFRGVAVGSDDLISIQTTEYDGAPLFNDPIIQGAPRLNLGAIDAYRAEIIGYAHCMSNDGAESGGNNGTPHTGAWMASQRTATSGIVINGASTNWCSNTGVGGEDGARVRQIILNMIEILANRQPLFVT